MCLYYNDNISIYLLSKNIGKLDGKLDGKYWKT